MSHHGEFDAKKVVVVGGTGGIGLACVRLFAEDGAKVGFTYHGRNHLAAQVVREYDSSTNVKAWKVDLESDESIEGLCLEISRDFKPLSALVMCQGIIEGKSLRDHEFPAIRRVFDVNILSIIKISKLLRPIMDSDSSMTFLSSVSAEKGSYDPVYAASKGAILSFTKAAAMEYAPQVRVNCIAPALTADTGMFMQVPEKIRERHRSATLLKRHAVPRDIAHAVLFLSSAAARHITGICLDVNGGEYLH